MTEKFDDEYFKKIMEGANGLGVDGGKVMQEQYDGLQYSNKGILKKLMEAEPKDFYNLLCLAYGSAMLNRTSNLIKVKLAASKSDNLGKDLKEKPAFVVWFFKAVRFVCAGILGVVKFLWDTTLVTGVFTVRFGCHLVKNVGKALWQTARETKNDAIGAGTAIGCSFRKNILNMDNKKEEVKEDKVGPTIVVENA